MFIISDYTIGEYIIEETQTNYKGVVADVVFKKSKIIYLFKFKQMEDIENISN